MTREARTILEATAEMAAAHIERRSNDTVHSSPDRERLRAEVAEFDFTKPMDGAFIAGRLFELLSCDTVRSDHPRYFGLFNPPALAPAIAGDLVTATVNPQLAVWGHAPAAAEIEAHLVDLFGDRIWGRGSHAGYFTSGGSEANHTAILAALARRYPNWERRGVAGLTQRPAIFTSAQSHLAWIKLARTAGLGTDAVKLVETRDGLSLDAQTLREAIEANADHDPFLIVATAGTTAHGAVDELSPIASVAREYGAHYHVDAAWAGGSLLSDRYRHVLAGIENADSVTIDPHKWLAVPMGAGLYLGRDWSPLHRAFNVATGYMPQGDAGTRDLYVHSLQWSRRFLGGKLFMALATLGLPGYAAMIDRQFELARYLRRRLSEEGWNILNRTELPLVCFDAGQKTVAAKEIESAVVQSGQAWISSVKLNGDDVLRACITGFETNEEDIEALVEVLGEARRAAG